MQLKDLISEIENQSDEELMQRLRDARQNRTVVRPASARRAKKASAQAARTQTTKVEKLLSGLSPEEIQILMDKAEENT